MKKLILVIIGALTLCALCGCAKMGALWSDVKYDNESAYTVGNGEITATVTEVEISWIDDGVEVKYYDGNTVKIEEKADEEIPQKLELRYLAEGGKLIIQFASNGRHDIRNLHKDLTVLFPQSTQLEKLKIENVSGDIHSEVAVKNFTASGVSGDIEIGNVSRSAAIHSVSGNVEVKAGSLNSVKAESVSGDVSLYIGGITSANVNTVSGTVNLFVPENLGFTLTFDTVSGDFYSSLATTQSGDTYTRLEGGVAISIDTVSGDVNIAVNA